MNPQQKFLHSGDPPEYSKLPYPKRVDVLALIGGANRRVFRSRGFQLFHLARFIVIQGLVL